MEIRAKELTEAIVKWTKEWFDENGKDCKAIIGMSGGKDSTVSAAICVKALGKDEGEDFYYKDGDTMPDIP